MSEPSSVSMAAAPTVALDVVQQFEERLHRLWGSISEDDRGNLVLQTRMMGANVVLTVRAGPTGVDTFVECVNARNANNASDAVIFGWFASVLRRSLVVRGYT